MSEFDISLFDLRKFELIWDIIKVDGLMFIKKLLEGNKKSKKRCVVHTLRICVLMSKGNKSMCKYMFICFNIENDLKLSLIIN